MKKLAILIFLISCAIFGFFLVTRYKTNNNSKVISKNKISPTVEQVDKIVTISRSIFIPYWNFDAPTDDLKDYDRFIYFGIAPSRDGINKYEAGYTGIEKFISFIPSGKEKYLTLRMIDDDINNFILENDDIQKKIIAESVKILEQNNFNGVVLDLEISNFLKKDLSRQINNFVQQFYSEVNKNYRKFFLAIYGDTFFRSRPFDLPFIAKYSDGIMIMAYDFHKSRGEPGPSFPFESRAKYGYDFKTMVEDFLQFVPKEKITVIFGMFGYDWLVDEKKRPIRQAEALSLNEIQKKFMEKCEFKNCVIKRDAVSKETEINYIVSSPTPDEENIYRIDYHIVWFEDEESAKVKTDYLKEQGIGSIGFWAYGYF